MIDQMVRSSVGHRKIQKNVLSLDRGVVKCLTDGVLINKLLQCRRARSAVPHVRFL